LRRRTLVVARFNRGLEIERISYKLDKASKLFKEFDGFQFLYNSFVGCNNLFPSMFPKKPPHMFL
jgi:hypothetical protein